MATIFKINGDAGTGKTTKVIQDYQETGTHFSAFSNKAKNVLLQKFPDLTATTIHGGLYRAELVKEEDVEIFATNPDGTFIWGFDGKIKKILVKKPIYEYRISEDSPMVKAKINVIDEASMIPSEIAYNVLKYCKNQIILVGDEKQLPPVDPTPILGYEKWFHSLPTDINLIINYRQKNGSNIITSALNAFKLGKITPINSDDCTISHRTFNLNYDAEDLLAYDKILCFTNKNRSDINRYYRFAKFGDDITFDYPLKGEILVAEKAHKKEGMKKGSDYKVLDSIPNKSTVILSLEDIITRERITTEQFLGTFNNPITTDKNICFSFSYASSIHKSQGSEWKKVLLLDDFYKFNKIDNKNELYYTAMTRAKNVLHSFRL